MHNTDTMIIKNVSGVTQYLAIGQRGGRGSKFARGRELANNASATFSDDSKSLDDARRLALAGIVSILSGPASAAEEGSEHAPASGTITIVTAGTSNGNFVTLNGIKFLYAAVVGTVVSPDVWAGAGAAGATAAGTLRTAVNAHATVGIKLGSTITIGTDSILPVTASAGTDITVGASYTMVKSGANISLSAATLADGIKGHVKETSIRTYTVSAGDVTATKWFIPTGLLSVPSNFLVQVKRAGAVLPTLACTFTFASVVPGNLVVDDSAASTLAASDVITIVAHGA